MSMTILETQIYRGANYWAPMPVIRLLLDIGELEERPTNKIPGFYEKLTTTLPGMFEHRCSVGKRGLSSNRCKLAAVAPRVRLAHARSLRG